MSEMGDTKRGTVYKRHRRWSADGTWQMLLTAIQAQQDAEGRLDWDISLDSTTVLAHTTWPAPAQGDGASPPRARVVADQRGCY